MDKTLNTSNYYDLGASIDVQSLNQDVRKLINTLKIDLKDAKETENQVRQQLAAQRSITSNLQINQNLEKKKCVRLQEKISNLEDEMKRMNEQLKSYRGASTIKFSGPSIDQIDSLRRDYDQLELEVNKKTTIIQNLNTQLNSTKSLLSSKITEVQTLSKQLKTQKSISGNKAPSQVKDPAFEKKYAEAIEQKSQFAQRKSELQKKLKNVNEQLNECNKLNQELRRKCDKLEQKLARKRDLEANSDFLISPSKSFEQVQKKGDDIDDQDQLTFPNCHQETVQFIVNYLKHIPNAKEKFRFLNILGALSQNQIEEISETFLEGE